MYLSHPVRRMRDDPHPDATVELIVTAGDDADRERLASALSDVGADVRERLRFGALRVEAAETAVADVCALEGIESIETGATRELAGGDAGEDAGEPR
jgi:hypothetical protein